MARKSSRILEIGASIKVLRVEASAAEYRKRIGETRIYSPKHILALQRELDILFQITSEQVFKVAGVVNNLTTKEPSVVYITPNGVRLMLVASEVEVV